jgi:hypothetical protein
MHTALVIALGLALLLGCLFVGHVLGDGAGMARAALYFLPLWLIGAAINMYMGVKGAGYTFAEEIPVLLWIFAIPAALALILWWKLVPR